MVLLAFPIGSLMNQATAMTKNSLKLTLKPMSIIHWSFGRHFFVFCSIHNLSDILPAGIYLTIALLRMLFYRVCIGT